MSTKGKAEPPLRLGQKRRTERPGDGDAGGE